MNWMKLATAGFAALCIVGSAFIADDAAKMALAGLAATVTGWVNFRRDASKEDEE
jgi:hypothetical protein